MTWVLLLIYFSGPTSADKVTYGGSFDTKAACVAEGNLRHKDAGDWPEYVCFPVPK